MDTIVNSEEYKSQIINDIFGEQIYIDVNKYAEPFKEKWENYFKNR